MNWAFILVSLTLITGLFPILQLCEDNQTLSMTCSTGVSDPQTVLPYPNHPRYHKTLHKIEAKEVLIYDVARIRTVLRLCGVGSPDRLCSR
jgi:hypothetical protein